MKALLTGLVVAAAPVLGAAETVTDVGKTTREVLEMQRAGRNAVAPKPLLGDVADRNYQRYLESFEHPIPAEFERGDSFNSSD